MDWRKRQRVFGIGDRLADEDALDPGQGHDVTCRGLGDGSMLEPFERVELRDTSLLDRAVEFAYRHAVADGDLAREHPANRDAPDIVVVVKRGDQHLQFARVPRGGCGNGLQDLLEQRAEVLRVVIETAARNAVAADRVQYREGDLRLGRVEIDEQVVNLVDDLLRTRVGPVELVHDYNSGEVVLECLA